MNDVVGGHSEFEHRVPGPRHGSGCGSIMGYMYNLFRRLSDGGLPSATA
jgi:hypothetical protein